MIPVTVKTDQISQQLQAKSVTPVKPVTPVIPVAGSADSGDMSHEFVQGRKYQALVEGRLPNGNYTVLISDKLLQMNLPEHIRPGDKMELLLLSREPRLKFVLQNENSVESNRNNTLISATGRFLDVLIQKTDQSISTDSPTHTQPIFSESSLNRRELPLLLQKAIQHSGLFYESHLAKWMEGNNMYDMIQQEPQSRLGMTPPSPAATALPVHPQSLSLVQQQLLVLETGHIVWQGEIWKDQHIYWDIHEDTAGHNTADDATAPRWKTTLVLTLPALGKITAAIALNPQGVQVSLDAVSEETLQLLRTNQMPLTANMLMAGIAVQSFEVQRNDGK